MKRSVGRPSYSHMLCYYKHSLSSSLSGPTSSSTSSSSCAGPIFSSSDREDTYDRNNGSYANGIEGVSVDSKGDTHAPDNDDDNQPDEDTIPYTSPSAVSVSSPSTSLQPVYKSDHFAIPDIFYR